MGTDFMVTQSAEKTNNSVRYAFAGFEKAALEDFKSRYDTTLLDR